MYKDPVNRKVARLKGGTAAEYTLYFAVFFFFCYLIYNILFHKDLFPDADGLSQQYVGFLYSGKQIRHILHNLFVSRSHEFPMWNMSLIGYDEIITYGGISPDPFSWISVFTPLRYGETAFAVMLMLKYYCSGLAFLLFCRQFGIKGRGAVIGALVYVFSGTMLIGAVQAGMINVFCLFPLLMTGADRLWKDGKYVFYTLILAYCTCVSWYYTYIMGLLMIIYCVIRFFTEPDKSIRRLFPLLGRFLLFTVIGIGIGIGPSVPALINTAGLDRLEIRRTFRLFYSYDRIKGLIGGWFGGVDLQCESYFGISSVFLPALYIIIRNRSRYRRTLILFALYYISFFFPLIGTLFNGNTYPAHRYIIGFVLLQSYITASAAGKFRELSARDHKILMAAGVFFAAAGIFMDELFGLMSAVSVIVTILLMRGVSAVKDEGRRSGLTMLAVFISCALIGLSFALTFTSIRGIDLGSATHLVTEAEGRDLVREQPDKDDVRYDRLTNYNGVFVNNSSSLNDINGYDFYYSSYNNYISRYIDDLGIMGDSMAFCYRSLHGRMYPEIMNGTGYLTVQDGITYGAPYLYSEAPGENRSGDYTLYTSDTGASMVFFYDEAVSQEVFDSFDPVEREDMMMHYLVTEDAPLTEMPAVSGACEIPFTVAGTEGMTYDGSCIQVTDEGAYMLLDPGTVEAEEIDILVRDLVFDTSDDQDTMRYQITPYLLYGGNKVAMEAYVAMTPNLGIYHYRPDWVLNFNVHGQRVDMIKICFDTPGSYSIDDIKLYARTRSIIDETAGAFTAMADAGSIEYSFSDNRIDICADNARDRFLYIAVPYSEGWSATVDGESVPVIRANTAFMAVELAAGHHNVELSYRTPYIGLGFGISLSSLILFCLTAAADKAIKRKGERA